MKGADTALVTGVTDRFPVRRKKDCSICGEGREVPYLRGAMVALLCACACIGWNYSAATKVREGNRLYGEERYKEAEGRYSDAMTDAPEQAELYFNAGDARYMQSHYEEALKLYEKAALKGSPEIKAKAFYNMGNVRYRMGEEGDDPEAFKDAVRHYIQALDIVPDDRDTKHNLEMAHLRLEQLEKQQQQGASDEEKEEKEGEEKEQQASAGSGDEKEEQEVGEKKEKGTGEKEETAQKTPEAVPQPSETATPAGSEEEEETEDLEESEVMRLLESYEREERDPTEFIKSQMDMRPMKVERDW